MRVVELNEDIYKTNNQYYADYDIQLQLTLLVTLMAITMSILKLSLPDWQISQTNLTTWLTLLALTMELQKLCKNSFAQGYTKLSDETKL